MEDNVLDIGLVRVPLLQRSGATLVPLERDEYVAALPRGIDLAEKGLLKLADMAGESFVMYAADQAGLYSTAMFPASRRA